MEMLAFMGVDFHSSPHAHAKVLFSFSFSFLDSNFQSLRLVSQSLSGGETQVLLSTFTNIISLLFSMIK